MIIRKAIRRDVTAIVALLANDKLGAQREKFSALLPDCYFEAFDAINKDLNQELVVLVSDSESILDTLQLSFLQYLTYQGGLRAQIEQVRIHESQRGKGLGKKLFQWAVERAKEKGAHLVQLTTDKQRQEALKFYESLGFAASHEGMKLQF